MNQLQKIFYYCVAIVTSIINIILNHRIMMIRSISRSFDAFANSGCNGRILARKLSTAPGGGLFASPDKPKKMLLLRYLYVDGMLEKRAPHRQDHIRHILAYSAGTSTSNSTSTNLLQVAGAVGNPNPTEGLFIFNENATRAAIEVFVENDPYKKNNLITNYSISDYTVVSGVNFSAV